jgi:hypothetical protein
MIENFEPRNELERQLVAAQEGLLETESLMDTLLVSQVFLPLRDDDKIKGFQRQTRAEPLSVTSEDGEPVLVVFSSPDRAKPFVRDFPGYDGGLLAEFIWVLEKMGTGYAIALNPGWEVGMDLAPPTVAALAARLGGGAAEG